MNRDEFEQAYAEKYLEGDYIVARDNRDGEGYADHHIDLCWKVQMFNDCNSCLHVEQIEW